jgi:hypothetical protein
MSLWALGDIADSVDGVVKGLWLLTTQLHHAHQPTAVASASDWCVENRRRRKSWLSSQCDKC